MYTEDQLLPISALQHLQFCRRRCALVHTERLWCENQWTAEGRVLHETVHQESGRRQGTHRIARGLQLASYSLGIYGIADVVEFTPVEIDSPSIHAEDKTCGIKIPGLTGLWMPRPIEYKRGRLKSDRSFTVQLCAQALCLEEMLKIDIASGEIYFGKSGRRKPIAFDSALRNDTKKLAAELHELLDSGKTPSPLFSKKCGECSLVEQCLPGLDKKRSASAYISQSLLSRLNPVAEIPEDPFEL